MSISLSGKKLTPQHFYDFGDKLSESLSGKTYRNIYWLLTQFFAVAKYFDLIEKIRDGFMACFEEACRQGPRGPVVDMALIAGPWGFDLEAVNVPAVLWHGERDRNVPVTHGRYLADAIPNCRASFYADDAHLSVPPNHQEEIFRALAAATAAA